MKKKNKKKSLLKVLDDPVGSTLAEVMGSCIDAGSKIRELRQEIRRLKDAK